MVRPASRAAAGQLCASPTGSAGRRGLRTVGFPNGDHGIVGRLGDSHRRGITTGVSGELIVRPARADELDQVGALTVAVYVADGYAGPTGSYATELADAARRARDAEVLVAVNPQDALLGTVTICMPGSRLGQLSRAGELEFRMLAVAHRARRRGVGELLVRAVLARAGEVGARRVVLSSAAEMRAAHRLYARLGFTRLPHLDWCPMPGVTLLAFGRATTTSGW